MPLVKEVRLGHLYELLAETEKMEQFTFDPASGQGEFFLRNGEMVFRLGLKEFSLTGEAWLKLGKMLGIPEDFNVKNPHQLMVPLMNYWLREKGIPKISFVVDYAGVIRCFSDGGALPISSVRILEEVMTQFGSNLSVHHVFHDYFATYFCLTHEVELAGQQVRFGLGVQNSNARGLLPEINPYVHLVDNGAILGSMGEDSAFRFKRVRGDTEADRERWIKESVKGVLSRQDLEMRRLERMKEVIIDRNLGNALAGAFLDFRIPVRMQGYIQDYVVAHGASSFYDLYRAVAYVACNSEVSLEDARLAYRMMKISGRFASHADLCTSCYRVVI